MQREGVLALGVGVWTRSPNKRNSSRRKNSKPHYIPLICRLGGPDSREIEAYLAKQEERRNNEDYSERRWKGSIDSQDPVLDYQI